MCLWKGRQSTRTHHGWRKQRSCYRRNFFHFWLGPSQEHVNFQFWSHPSSICSSDLLQNIAIARYVGQSGVKPGSRQTRDNPSQGLNFIPTSNAMSRLLNKKQSQRERWTPEPWLSTLPRNSYSTDRILASTASFLRARLKGQRTLATTPNSYIGKVSLGSASLYVPLTLPQQSALPHGPTYHMLQFCAMKALFLDTETHPCHYFELEKHSYKMITGMSCYPLRMYFFSKYLWWDAGRMVSSGQIINHSLASRGTRKDPNCVWGRELLDAVRKHPQAIQDREREK